jgi:hypothetical protein
MTMGAGREGRSRRTRICTDRHLFLTSRKEVTGASRDVQAPGGFASATMSTVNRRSWLMVRARRSGLRTIAVLQVTAAAGWWLLTFYPGRNAWFLLVAILWTLVAVRTLVSWRLWRPQPWPPGEPSGTEPPETEPSKR